MCHPEPIMGGAGEDVRPVEQVTISAGSERVPAYLSRPAGSGPSPALLLITDVFGASPFYQEMAGRLAHEGYTTLVPDVFHRVGELMEQTLPAAVERAGKLIDDLLVQDLSASIDYLQGRPEAGRLHGLLHGWDVHDDHGSPPPRRHRRGRDLLRIPREWPSVCDATTLRDRRGLQDYSPDDRLLGRSGRRRRYGQCRQTARRDAAVAQGLQLHHLPRRRSRLYGAPLGAGCCCSRRRLAEHAAILRQEPASRFAGAVSPWLRILRVQI